MAIRDFIIAPLETTMPLLRRRSALCFVLAVLAGSFLPAFATENSFPFGTALGVATLVILLGYRNSTLYDSL